MSSDISIDAYQGQTVEEAGDPIVKFKLCAKVSKETDKYTEKIFDMLIGKKEDDIIECIINTHQDSRPNLNCSKEDTTYLQYACRHGLEKVARYLINAGADLTVVCSQHHYSPLYKAIISQNFEIATYILDNHPEQLFMYYYRYHYNVLHVICDFIEEPNNEVLQFLKYILKKVNASHDSVDMKDARYLLNEEDCNERTPLNIAVEKGYDRVIIVLLENGVDVFRKNSLGDFDFLDMTPNILEEYFDRKLKEDLIAKCGKILLDYNNIVPPECFGFENNVEETSRIVQLSELPDFRHLIKHPVISTFVNLKWKKIQWLFTLNLIIYLTFCLFFTRHVLAHEEDKMYLAAVPIWVATIFFILQELHKLILSRQTYFCNLENVIKLFLIPTTILTMLGNTMNNQVPAIAVFLTWTELMIIMARIPELSITIEMYKRISLTFFRYLSSYFIFFIAFALSFYILFYDISTEEKPVPVTDTLPNVTITLFNTLIMFGDFDPDKVPLKKHALIGRVLSLMFLLFICIVKLTLLIGLGVSDTKSILEEADLYVHISRLKCISSFEKTAKMFGNKVMSRVQVFYHPECHEKNGCLAVLKNNMEPSVYKNLRKIKIACRKKTRKEKLNDLLMKMKR